MFLAKVIGSIVSSQKSCRCNGMKLLLIQPHVPDAGKLVPSGSAVVAIDTVGAGEGNLVMFVQGSSARLTDITKDAPVDAAIIGIVDAVESGGRRIAT